MARIEESVVIAAPPGRVWAVLTDWEGQARWMHDARSVRVLGERREGPGVVLRCATDLFGVVVDDDMEVVEWVEGERIGVRHLRMLIRGVGAFELHPAGDGTRFIWWEEIEVPLGTVGDALAQVLVAPLVARVFRRSLAALKGICEQPTR